MSDEQTAVKLGIVDYFKMLWNGRSAVETVLQQGKLSSAEYHKGGIRSLSFWLSILTGIGAVGAQVAGFIPSPYGAAALALSASGYAIARGLGKQNDPTASVKPTLATSEGIANILAIIAQVTMAWQGVVTPEVAAILTQINSVAIAASRALAAGGNGADASKDAANGAASPEAKELP